MRARRWMVIAAAVLGFLPALARGQDSPPEEQDPNKISNDDPARPLQMPPASSEVKEALDDFDRFQRRNAWERALKALYTIQEDQAKRFVDGEDGFIITVGRKRRDLLVNLPPEGQAAYRLFYDSDAQKLYDEAKGPNELETLERIYSAYFTTAIGDNAADRLGDLYYEMGRFDRAADCWLAVLRERTDTDLAPASLAVKAALALARAGRRTELAELRRELADRYAGDEVTLGGQTGTPEEILRKVLDDADPPASASASPASSAESESESRSESGAALDLEKLKEATWQLKFGESVTAGMTPTEMTQWESSTFCYAVPAVAIDGQKLFVNYLGHDFAVDLNTGKMLWRSSAFHHVDLAAMQQQFGIIDTTRYAVVAKDEYLWSLGRDPRDQNYMGTFSLTCRRTDTGDLVWRSADLPDYNGIDFNGPPMLAGDKLFIPAKTQSNQGLQAQSVLAIRPRDGKLLWKAEAGMLRQGQMYYYYGPQTSDAQPRLLYRAGAIYVDTHDGILARLDAESGDMEWGYGYPTDPSQSQGRMIFFNGYPQMVEAATTSSRPLSIGDALLVKGAKSDRLSAIDPDRMKRLWERPIAKSSRLLGYEGEALFLGGPDLDGLNLATRDLRWSTRLPGGSSEARLLVSGEGIWQLTSRGIFEIDPSSGDVRRIFRGDDTGSAGGNLFLTDRLLLAVSNRTISAYALSAAADNGPGASASTKGEADADDEE